MDKTTHPTKKPVMVWMPTDLAATARALALRDGRSLAALIRVLLQREIDKAARS
jgi:hypothetical protein